MNKNLIFIFIPIIIALEFYGFGWVNELIRTASDSQVILALVLLTLLSGINYFLTVFFIKLYRKNNK